MSELKEEEEIDEFEVIGLSELNIGDHPENEASLRTRFDSLPPEKQEELLQPASWLKELERYLISGGYFTLNIRSYFRLLFDYLEPDRRVVVPDLYEEPRRKYIGKPTRIGVLEVLLKWKNVLIAIGEEQESPFFLRNNVITSEFRNWALSCGLRCNMRRNSSATRYLVTGTKTLDEFERLIGEFSGDWRSAHIEYEYRAPMMDESLRFGDPYNATFVLAAH